MHAVLLFALVHISVVTSKSIYSYDRQLIADELEPQPTVDVASIENKVQKSTDTKKQYYLLKIKEYYDFLPLTISEVERNEKERQLRLEIDDSLEDRITSKELINHNEKVTNTNRISIEKQRKTCTNCSLKDGDDDDDDDERLYLKRDLPDVTVDSDDPNNNNFRYVAYVPFFRFNEYISQKKHLDFGL